MISANARWNESQSVMRDVGIRTTGINYTGSPAFSAARVRRMP